MSLILTTVMQNILFHVKWYTLLHAQSMYACRTDDDVSSWCHVITMKYWPHENKQRHVVYIVCVIAIQHDFPTPPNFVPTIRKGGIMSRRRYTKNNKYTYDYIYYYFNSRMNIINNLNAANYRYLTSRQYIHPYNIINHCQAIANSDDNEVGTSNMTTYMVNKGLHNVFL